MRWRRRGAGRRLAAAVVAGGAGLLLLDGCGSATRPGDQIAGHTLTIYASVPYRGASSDDAGAVVRGEALALSQTHGRIGRYRIVLRTLDDSVPGRAGWDPGQTSLNARLALADRTTIGYLGDFNSGASAISIPLLNRAGIPQISAASSAVGLTAGAAGASPGEPQKYYPSGARTFARVVPNDTIQSVAQLKLQRRAGCRRTYVLDDGAVDSQETAESFALSASSGGVRVVAVTAFDPLASDYSALAVAVAQSGANCTLISAIGDPGDALLTRQIAETAPRMRLFASAGLGGRGYVDPGAGGIPSSVGRRVTITLPALDPASYPRVGRAFYAALAARYGSSGPYAIYGYEAMSLLLSAISRATGGGARRAKRSKVLGSIFKTRDRQSVLGTYSLDSDGDTTLRRYGAYRIVRGRLSFWTAVEG